MVAPVEDYRMVSDFCPRIAEVKASALASGFGTWRPPLGETGHAEYRGLSFHGLHSLMVASLAMALGGAQIFPNALFFRVTGTDADAPYVHSDREDGAKTAIAYLSEHDGGTAFFRHRRTGMVRMPAVSEMKRLGLFESLYADMKRGPDPEIWEQTDFARGGFNRALIFDAPLFHARMLGEDAGATDDPARARMVWVCHYHAAQTVLDQRPG